MRHQPIKQGLDLILRVLAGHSLELGGQLVATVLALAEPDDGTGFQ
jgi:hypothetical protein